MNDRIGKKCDCCAEDGMVLVAVIWLLALLGGLVTAMSMFTTNALSNIEAYTDRRQVMASVTGGVDEAVLAILNAAARGKADRPGVLKGRSGRVTFEALSETARIDINAAPPELLAGLFARLGTPAASAVEYAGLILKVRGGAIGVEVSGGPASALPVSPVASGGATVAISTAQPQSRPPGRATFVDVAELNQIAGLPPKLIERAAPFLTTFSANPQVDLFAAPVEIIESLPGMTRERVRSLLSLRGDLDATPERMLDAIGDAKRFVTTKPSPVIRIKVGVALPDGYNSISEVVVVHFPDDHKPYRVLSWDDDVLEGRRP